MDVLLLHLGREMLVAVEIEGALHPGHIPRFTRGEREQMSSEWLDNPVMLSVSLSSADLYAAVVTANLADTALRTALRRDLMRFVPVLGASKLADPNSC